MGDMQVGYVGFMGTNRFEANSVKTDEYTHVISIKQSDGSSTNVYLTKDDYIKVRDAKAQGKNVHVLN